MYLIICSGKYVSFNQKLQAIYSCLLNANDLEQFQGLKSKILTQIQHGKFEHVSFSSLKFIFIRHGIFECKLVRTSVLSENDDEDVGVRSAASFVSCDNADCVRSFYDNNMV